MVMEETTTTNNLGGNNNNVDGENENENNNNESHILIVQQDPERYPHIVLKGTAANLSALRGTDAQTRATFFDERNCPSSSSPPLLMESSVLVSVTTTTTTTTATATATAATATADDEHDEESNTVSNHHQQVVRGELFVTNTQVLFVATERDQLECDLAIGAACVVLHAMTDDPELAVYLQLSNDDDFGATSDDDTPTEITLTPIHNDNDSDCQKIFDALCKLISLHPVELDDDDNDDGGGGMFGYGGIGGGFGDDYAADYGEGDGFVWAPSATAAADATTTGERDAMLDHLDSLLVVRPELEVKEGQFDDADD